MEFKGTKGDFKEDIGIYLLGVNDELMQIIVYSKQVNTHSVAHVFGLSQEEVMVNAKLFVYSKKMFEMLKDVLKMQIPDYAKFEIEKLLTKITE